MDKSIQTLLAAPFDDADIEWRLQWADDEKGSGIAVPYVTNRAIQNRLDKVVGIDHWKNEYVSWHNDGKKASQICGIAIYFQERSEWITKYDGAENSDIEPIKGGLSDSMKRAAVQWGVGRYLYSTETVFVNTEKRGRNTIIKPSEQSKLNRAHQEVIAKLFGKDASKASAQQKPPAAQTQPTPIASAIAPEAPQEASQPVTPAAPQAAQPPPGNAYCVMNIALHPTIKGTNNSHIQLKGSDGKVIPVHMQGENPGLVPGAWITDARISQKTKDGVLYYILEEFRFAQQAAA